jgi:hypothetical protein
VKVPALTCGDRPQWDGRKAACTALSAALLAARLVTVRAVWVGSAYRMVHFWHHRAASRAFWVVCLVLDDQLRIKSSSGSIQIRFAWCPRRSIQDQALAALYSLLDAPPAPAHQQQPLIASPSLAAPADHSPPTQATSAHRTEVARRARCCKLLIKVCGPGLGHRLDVGSPCAPDSPPPLPSNVPPTDRKFVGVWLATMAR